MFKIIIIFSIIIFSESSISFSELAKGPTSYTNGTYVAEVFPPNSRLKNSKPTCFFYKINRLENNEEYNPNKRFELVWQEELINFPSLAMISGNGYFITFSENPSQSIKFSKALVLYNKNGTLIKDFVLEDIIPQKDWQKIEITSLFSFWGENAKFYLTNPFYEGKGQSWWDPTYLYIVFRYGSVVELKLADGTLKYDKLEKLRHIDSLVAKSHTPARIYKFWENSLEYSSITELLGKTDNDLNEVYIYIIIVFSASMILLFIRKKKLFDK